MPATSEVPVPPESPAEPGTPRRPPRLPLGTAITVVVLLAIPCIALALVPTYSSESPHLWGWPFFYWYQVLWVLITPILTYAAYRLIKKARQQ